MNVFCSFLAKRQICTLGYYGRDVVRVRVGGSVRVRVGAIFSVGDKVRGRVAISKLKKT